MLLKLGACISRLEYHCRRALNTVDKIWKTQGYSEAVITSTFEGTHSAASLHYQNRAFDVRWPVTNKAKRSLLVVTLKAALGKDFDVIAEASHIHIEYDPK